MSCDHFYRSPSEFMNCGQHHITSMIAEYNDKRSSITEAERIRSKTTLQTRRTRQHRGPCMRLQAAPLNLTYSPGLRWEVGPVLTAEPPGHACVCAPTPAELKVKRWEQVLAASGVQFKSKPVTVIYRFATITSRLHQPVSSAVSHTCSLL